MLTSFDKIFCILERLNLRAHFSEKGIWMIKGIVLFCLSLTISL